MKRIIAGVICGIALAAASAFADPVVVTGGTVTTTSYNGSFDLTGAGFEAAGNADTNFDSRMFSCKPCTPASNTLLGFGGNGDVGSMGTLKVNGTSYPLFGSGMLQFSSEASFTSAVLSPTNLTLTAPFTMTATLDGIAKGDGSPAFSTDLAGGGIATAHFIMDPPTPMYPQLFEAETVTYQFQPAGSPSPTPEPASLWLFGVDLLGAVVVRHRLAW